MPNRESFDEGKLFAQKLRDGVMVGMKKDFNQFKRAETFNLGSIESQMTFESVAYIY